VYLPVYLSVYLASQPGWTLTELYRWGLLVLATAA